MMHSKHLKACALSSVNKFPLLTLPWGIGGYGIFGGRSTAEDGIMLQEYYEDTLAAPKYWKVTKADKEDIDDAIIKFKTNKKDELLIKVKLDDGSSEGWYQGAVNTAGVIWFESGLIGTSFSKPWAGNIASDGGYIGFIVGYNDQTAGIGVGQAIAVPVWQ